MANATNRWLDKLAAADKAKGGTGSDYALSGLLGIERQRVSRYRRGADKTMGDDTAIKLAELLGLHPMIVIAEIRAEQSRDVRAARVWDQVAKAAKGGKIAAVILAASLGAIAEPNSAIGKGESPSSAPGRPVPVCILCKVPSTARRAANDPVFWPRRRRLTPGRIRTLELAA